MNNPMTYIQNGDYQIPDLKLSQQPEKPLGKYGRMRNCAPDKRAESEHKYALKIIFLNRGIIHLSNTPKFKQCDAIYCIIFCSNIQREAEK